MLEYLKPIVDLKNYIDKPLAVGIRYNPLRINRDDFEKILPYKIERIPFYKYGYLLKNEQNAGRNPLHAAGVYYIQEPSAMAAITALDVQPDNNVLDLCAAPGSKSTAIAAELTDGILVSNEISSMRAKSLMSNIERMGISRAMVTNCSPDELTNTFNGYFDRVLVDSPCSGEGMFRKHPQVVLQWSIENVLACAKRSKKIIADAAKMVKPGGRLVYSTCTFNTEENEKVIIDFLNSHTDFRLVDSKIQGACPGLLGLTKAARIYPSECSEGHFIAALERKDGSAHSAIKYFKSNTTQSGCENIIKQPFKFIGNNNSRYVVFSTAASKLVIPQVMPKPDKIKILRAGVKILEQNFKTQLPCHHLFMANDPENFCKQIMVDEKNAEKFLSGIPLDISNNISGFTAVIYKSFCIGFGKASRGVLKNHLPKGLILS